MKIFGKEKASLKANPKGTGPELLELVTLMTKIAERLEALEKKMDLMIGQTPARSPEGRGHSKPASQTFAPSQPLRQSVPPGRPYEVNPAQGPTHGQARGRRERLLHKAVCADCHKDCEIPFKPTGERPVYCKQCFSQRKAGRPLKEDHGDNPELNPPEVAEPIAPSQRQVFVTKKGVGKVTVSEIVRPSSRDTFPKRKDLPPEKKSRK